MLPHAVFAAAFMYIVAMVTIRKAGDGDYAIVRDLYYAITDGMQASGVSNSYLSISGIHKVCHRF